MSDDLSTSNVATTFVEAMLIAAEQLPKPHQDHFVIRVRQIVSRFTDYPNQKQRFSDPEKSLLRAFLSDLEKRCDSLPPLDSDNFH